LSKEKCGVIILLMRKGGIKMTKVVVTNGNIDSALKKFKIKVARSGVPSELKKRKCYEKPGVKRREAKKEMIRNARKHHRD
jgi:small subunit ribosomal protein S21